MVRFVSYAYLDEDEGVEEPLYEHRYGPQQPHSPWSLFECLQWRRVAGRVGEGVKNAVTAPRSMEPV